MVAQASALLELDKTSRVAMKHEMNERSYDFFYNILNKVVKTKLKKMRQWFFYGHATL